MISICNFFDINDFNRFCIQESFDVLHFNMYVLGKNFDELCLILNEIKANISVIVLSETCFSPNENHPI